MIPRKKYFQRREEPKNIIWQPYDTRILDLCDEHRFLDFELLLALLRVDFPKLTEDTLKHRLSKLWQSGFLERPVEQILLHLRDGQKSLIHCLSREGAEILAEKSGKDPERLKWRTNFARANYKLISHGLGIARVRAAFELLQDFQILFWKGDGEFKRRVRFRIVTEEQARFFRPSEIVSRGLPIGEEARLLICPDSLFGVRRDRPHFFALELDYGTRTIRAMGRKFLAYYKLLQGLKEEPIALEGFQISHFRVLTIAPTQTRIAHLREACRRIDERGKGFRAFLFAEREQISCQEPESLLKPIWQTPIEGEMTALFG